MLAELRKAAAPPSKQLVMVNAAGNAIDRQELFGRVECEMPGIVVGEVKRFGPVADDEELNEAEKRTGMAFERQASMYARGIMPDPPRPRR